MLEEILKYGEMVAVISGAIGTLYIMLKKAKDKILQGTQENLNKISKAVDTNSKLIAETYKRLNKKIESIQEGQDDIKNVTEEIVDIINSISEVQGISTNLIIDKLKVDNSTKQILKDKTINIDKAAQSSKALVNNTCRAPKVFK